MGNIFGLTSVVFLLRIPSLGVYTLFLFHCWKLYFSCPSPHGRSLQVQVCQDVGPGDAAADRLNIFNTSNSLQVGSMFTLDLSFSGASLESSSIVLLSLASRSFPIKSWRLAQGPGWIVIMKIDCNWWTNFLAGRKYACRGNSFTSGAQWWEFFLPSCQTSLPLYIIYTPIMLCLMKCRIFCAQSALIDLGRFKCLCKGKGSNIIRNNFGAETLWLILEIVPKNWNIFCWRMIGAVTSRSLS